MNWCTGVLTVFGAVLAAGALAHAEGSDAQSVHHKLDRVVLDAGNLGKTLPQGYSTIEDAAVECTNFSGCTLSLSILANVGTATCKDEWAIDGEVDGVSVDGAPMQAPLPIPGTTRTELWQGDWHVVRDPHTITFQVYLPCAANINQWSVRYLITEP